MGNKEKQLRTEIRKILIEEYAVNGLENLSAREVQRRLKILEAKVINQKAKMNKKMLGSSSTNGNTFNNADFLKGKPAKSKMGAIPSAATKANKLDGKRAVKQVKMGTTTTSAKFSTKKEKPFKAFDKGQKREKKY